MTQKIKFENPNEFLEYNSDRLTDEYFEHYHLNDLFESLKDGQGQLYDVFNIIGNDGTNILAVWADISYYIYGTKWNDEAIEILASSIDIENYDILVLRGQKGLINAVIDVKKIKVNIINDRIIYDCKSSSENIDSNGKLVLGSENNYPEILNLNLGYYHEDFNGQGSQSDEKIAGSVQMGILKGKMYAWKVDRQLTSVLRVINNDSSNIMIGGLFTAKEHRQKGFASDLLKIATTEILKGGAKKCGLVTDRENIGSNNAVKSANYQEKYEWMNAQIIV